MKQLPGAQALYDPSLLGKPRYMNDQHDGPIQRTPEQEARLREMMSRAEVLFSYVPEYQPEIRRHLPRVIISPHSAGAADTENAKLTQLFSTTT